jgi:hypothetical protein
MRMTLAEERRAPELKWQRVRYTMQERRLTREVIDSP